VATRKNATTTLRKLHTEELQYLYHSENIIGISRTTFVQHAVRWELEIDKKKNLVGKPKCKRSHGKS